MSRSLAAAIGRVNLSDPVDCRAHLRINGWCVDRIEAPILALIIEAARRHRAQLRSADSFIRDRLGGAFP
jgi:hypothetical protein